jgi:hypothetical protein
MARRLVSRWYQAFTGSPWGSDPQKHPEYFFWGVPPSLRLTGALVERDGDNTKAAV